MNKYKVGVVIVTHNRKDMLYACVNSVLSQTYKINRVSIIDNASNDGTQNFLLNRIKDKRIDYIYLKNNIGGAGGFYYGIKRLYDSKTKFDFIWIMDDDCEPNVDCLENLIIKYDFLIKTKTKISFLASTVYDLNGNLTNVPTINNDIENNGYTFWAEYLKDGLVSISSATFVSLLLSFDAVDKCGFPCKDYFIWGDDTEYTTRLVKYYGKAYLVGSSSIVHKRLNNKEIFILNEYDISRIKMYYYHYRNSVINSIFYNERKVIAIIRVIRNMFIPFKQIFTKHGFYKIYISFKGTFSGFINYRRFKIFIIDQIKILRENK